MSEKIRSEHLQRGAYVYVRQSTAYQVRNHLEGKERQYALAERAKQLGFSKVIVIDEDLGRSGSGSQERMGFGRLLASVCQGLAGAVFALEASRLARTIEIGIIWLTFVHWRKLCSSTPMESMIRAH
jgi:DNA invertase Pin-like site-specific DNA recombinase